VSQLFGPRVSGTADADAAGSGGEAGDLHRVIVEVGQGRYVGSVREAADGGRLDRDLPRKAPDTRGGAGDGGVRADQRLATDEEQLVADPRRGDGVERGEIVGPEGVGAGWVDGG
jgi:hypothetical protein